MCREARARRPWRASRLPGPPSVLLALLVACIAVLSCATSAPVAPAASPPRAVASQATAPPTAAPLTSAPAGSGPTADGAPSVKGELTIFAAASLADAFQELGTSVERANPGSKVTFSFAGSSALRTQLGQGARADVFASADEANMQGAQKDGSIAGEPRIFARNRLVIITPAQQKVDVARPQDLARPGLKLVIGQKDLPAGNYARQVFAKMDRDPSYGSGFAERALANVASEESNVKQIVSKVQLGEADAGVVYSTDVTPAVRSEVKVITIPDDLNVIARYPVALVKVAANQDGAKAFVGYLLSPAGQAVLERHGFIRADATP